MDDQIVVLDSSYFLGKEQGTLVLRGWMYVGNALPEIQARAGRRKVSARLTRTARPDVCAARPDLAFPNGQAGFEIRLPEMEPLFASEETLRVRILAGGRSFPVLEKSLQELAGAARDSALLINLDRVQKQDAQIVVEGWCVNFFGNRPSLRFLLDDGTALSDVKLTLSRREDVRKEYDVANDNILAFKAVLPRKQVRSAHLRLEFTSEASRAETALSMKEFDRENTRAYRLRRLVGRSHWQDNKKRIQEGGIRTFLGYLWEQSSTHDSYYDYAKAHTAARGELAAQAKEVFSPAPFFSIVVPLYETPLPYLKELLDSVCGQSYQRWELCLADGTKDTHLEEYIRRHYRKEPRIRYQHLSENTGISGNTNAALQMAQGDFLVFADHDDFLEPDALYLAARGFEKHPEWEMLYTDEDLVDEDGRNFYPHFKPDFNLELLRCINYICHLLIVRRELYERVGALNPAYDGAQDYDFLLRCVEQAGQGEGTRSGVGHIPKVLYHWRSHPGSTAGNQDSKQYAIDASVKALSDHYRRLGMDAEVEYTGTFIVLRSRFPVQGNPKISILIPNKDHIAVLEKCIVSIEEKSTWKNREILVIENNSEDPETFAYYEKLKERFSDIRLVTYTGSFNYSAINNFGAKAADGEYLLLLNNDTEVINPDWMERMVSLCQREHSGIAGAKLFYPDDTIQHAGIVIGIGGFAGHIQTGYTSLFTGYLGRLITTQEISAVTGACLMVKRSVYEEVGGLDEEFAVALNDVDFCLRVREKGYLVYLTPEAKLYHYESKSRGFEDTPEKQERFDREIGRFQRRYEKLLAAGDPYYNPNLTLALGDCSVRRNHEILKIIK